jgi:hypothetical protein
MRCWWSRSARREVFCLRSWCALSLGPSRGVGVGCPLRELSPAASPCGSRHRAALQRRLLWPLPQRISHASLSRSVRSPTRRASTRLRARANSATRRARTPIAAHALRAASESRRGLHADRGFVCRTSRCRAKSRSVTNPVGRRVRVSSQATTHERQSVRRRRLRACDRWFRSNRSDD